MATKKLPKTLAESTRKKADAARARLLARAREDVALIKRRKQEITEAFYDIGEALLRLRKEPIPKLLGYDGFGELCSRGLGIAASSANDLIAIVTRVSRRDALKWGKEKTLALVALADATPAEDEPTAIDAKALEGLDPNKASVRELKAPAKAQRTVAKQKGAASRGRTSSAEERRVAAAIQTALRKAGVKTATVSAVATRPGAASNVRIEGVPFAALRLLRRALPAR
ncbi:MAG: hypothetical protein HYV09_40275 [Deltaproteobacteria bacterium]|nr:hypothetical protein [Deltaproteobacteria bacterium]